MRELNMGEIDVVAGAGRISDFSGVVGGFIAGIIAKPIASAIPDIDIIFVGSLRQLFINQAVNAGQAAGSSFGSRIEAIIPDFILNIIG